MELRWYQEEARGAVLDYLRSEPGDPCVCLPTGAGKTPLLAALAQDAVGWGRRVAVLAHVKELLEQSAARLSATLGPEMVGVYSAGLKSRDKEAWVTVCGIQSVYKKAFELCVCKPIDLVIVDECFPAGTKITTPHGDVNIEDLYVGQAVNHALGVGTVEATSARLAQDIVTLELEDGTVIKCTPNHPLFTDKGWQRAWDLEPGAVLFGEKDLSLLRGGVSSLGEERAQNEGARVGQAAFLFNLLLQESGERNAAARSEGEGERDHEGEKMETANPWGKWPGPYENAECVVATSWLGMACGIRRDDDAQPAPQDERREMLQSGLGRPVVDDCGGAGRQFAQDAGSQNGGQKEKGLPRGIRVASVARCEPDRPVMVYNLQVSGHPSYFANGVLVHNCHLIPNTDGTMYKKFLADLKTANPKARVVGLTATPYRLDSGVIYDGDGFFDDLVYNASIPELISQGFLSPLKSVGGGLAAADLAGVHVRAGEYAADEMAAAFDKVLGAAMGEVFRRTLDRKAVLIFCSSVAAAQEVARLVEGAGQRCGVVTGETPAEERATLVRQFRNGEVKFLANCNVLTTGFDAPNVDCVALLRATKSPGLYYQMVGRGFRVCEGKQDCLVLDFGHNVEEHGCVDRIIPPIKRKGAPKAGKLTISTGPRMKECPQCGEFAPIMATQCADCGYQFPQKVGDEAYAGDIVSGGAPVERELSVDGVDYEAHVAKGAEDDPTRPKTLQATYHCGLFSTENVREWVCVEHGGYAGEKAAAWWRERAPQGVTMPRDAAQAARLAGAGVLKTPAKILLRYEDGSRWPRVAKVLEWAEGPSEEERSAKADAVPALNKEYADEMKGAAEVMARWGYLTEEDAQTTMDEVPW